MNNFNRQTKACFAVMALFAAACPVAFPSSATAAEAATKIREIKVAQPLRDPAVAYDADRKMYYLTGTIGTPGKNGDVDFDSNRGIFLWKSSDLENWQELGWAWEFTKQGRQLGWPFQLEVLLPEATRYGHALRAAELHRVGNQWILCFSKNGMNAGLMTSQSPEKPFTMLDGEFWPKPAKPGESGFFCRNSPYSHMIPGDPSLFQDKDGAIHLIWGGGAIVKLKPDLTGWAESPRHLQAAIAGWPATATKTELTQEEGASLFRDQASGAYFLTFAAWSAQGGRARYDTWICKSTALYGPYSEPVVLIPSGGQVKLFVDPAGVRLACMENGKPVIMNVNLNSIK